MTLAADIEGKLRAAFAPTDVQVQDDSAAHAGHGASGAHVSIRVVSAAFAGKSRVERHRMVYALFADELAGASARIHALQIDARAPGEP
jgi:BolA protein